MRGSIIALATLLSIPLYAGEYTDVRELELNTDNLKGFYADTAAGYLKITGNDEIDQIIVKATIRIETKSSFDDVDAQKLIDEKLVLKLSESGSKGKLLVKFESNFLNFSNLYRQVDLDIEMPANLFLEIEDGSGSITISDMKKGLYIEDGSGSIELTDSAGEITIKDGSGPVVVKLVQGDISIDDGSGSIDVSQVEGNIEIDDGSGSIVISDITGSVRIDDGSGSIDISGVSNDFTLVDDGSGRVNLSDINGDVRGYNDGKRKRDLK